MPREQFITHRILVKLRVAIAYLSLSSLFSLPILSGRYSFPDGDFSYHFFPFHLHLHRSLASGQNPLWNPFTYGGHPFLADVQAAVFYPISLILQWLTLPWSAGPIRYYLLEWEVVIHLALAGFFTFLFVSSLVDSFWAAFAAGSVFAFSGYLTGYPPLQLAILRTAIWLPLLFWLITIWLSRGRSRAWIGAAVVHAIAFFAGHPQTFLFLTYAAAGWALALAGALGFLRSKQRLLRLGMQAFGYAGLLVLLTAVQLWPSWELTRYSVRARLDYQIVSGGFPPADTWQFLLPGFLTYFSPHYIGIAALGLSVLGLGTLRMSSVDGVRRVAVYYFATLALFSLLLSYGDNGPLFAIFYQYVPGWRLFQGQERIAYLFVFSLSVLVGYGFQAFYHRPQSTRIAVGYAILAALLLLYVALARQLPGSTDVTSQMFLAKALIALLILASFVASSRFRATRWFQPLLVGLLLFDLFQANMGTNLEPVSLAQRVKVPAPAVALQEELKSSENNPVVHRIFNEYRLPENAGMLYGWEDTWGSSPLRLRRYASLFDQFPLDRLWTLTGVKYVLTWRRDLFVPSRLLAEFPAETDTTYIHQLEEPTDRAWVATTLIPVDDREAHALLADHSVDLSETVLVEPGYRSDQILDTAVTPAPSGEETVEPHHLSSTHWKIRVERSRPGLLFLSENWLPGWEYRLIRDGSESGFEPVVRANLAFLGVPVQAGDSLVEIRYRPMSFIRGAWISGVTTLLLLAFGLISLFRRRSRNMLASRTLGWCPGE